MSRKSQLLNKKIDAAHSLAASFTGPVTCIQYLDNIGIQLNFIGTPTGTFAIEGSMDHQASEPTQNVTNAGNWTQITSGAATGGPGVLVFDINQTSFPFIRVRYIRTGGVGSVDIWITGKQL